MKFTPEHWREVKPDTKGGGWYFRPPPGRADLRLSAVAPIYLEVDGVEALFAVDTEAKITFTPGDAYIRIPAGDYRVFIFDPHRHVHESDEAPYSNIDLRPALDPNTAALQRMMRQFKLEQRQVLDEMRLQHEQRLERQRQVEGDGEGEGEAEAEAEDPPQVADEERVTISDGK